MKTQVSRANFIINAIHSNNMYNVQDNISMKVYEL